MPPPPGTETAILEAAAEYALDRVASQFSDVNGLDLVIDRALLRGSSNLSGAKLHPGLAEAIADRRGGRVGTLDDHLTCPSNGPPGRCFLKGADVVVTFGRPEITGESGTIMFQQFARSSARMESPQAYRSSGVLKVARVNGTWEVTGVESFSVS